jgi:hypothetical protein
MVVFGSSSPGYRPLSDSWPSSACSLRRTARNLACAPAKINSVRTRIHLHHRRLVRRCGDLTRTHVIARAKDGEKTAKTFLPAAVRVYFLAMNATRTNSPYPA